MSHTVSDGAEPWLPWLGNRHPLAGRIALVTGASSGLGMRFAGVLAAAGARVAVSARRVERLHDLVDKIGAAGGEALAVPMDVSDEASVKAGFDVVEGAFGVIDTVVANAGVASDGPALSIDAAAVDHTLSINVRGSFLTAREGARRMIDAEKAGRIVLTASIAAEAVEVGLSIYSASKAGVVQMGKVMAREWLRYGINVNMLCPGYIRTELNEEWFDSEGGRRQIARFGRKRLMDEAALDPLLVYLCSDLSEPVTGASFVIDDGQTL